MNLEVILRAGLSTGTILIFAAIGEIIAERAGVMNLGVEGMMLIGAMAAFKVAYVTQNAWLGLLAGILAGGILSLAHGLVVSSFPGRSNGQRAFIDISGDRTGPGPG